MSDRDQVITQLRAGSCLRLFLQDMSFADGHKQIDGLEAQVGLPLIRREVTDSTGRMLIVRRVGSELSPVEKQYERLNHEPRRSAAD